jgi:type IV pilus assembly protein PilB
MRYKSLKEHKLARKRIGEILVELEYLTLEQLTEAIMDTMESGQRMGDHLVEQGIIDEEQITEALATQFDMRYVDLEDFEVSKEAISLVPESAARDNHIMPLDIDEGSLLVAISDPFNIDITDNLSFLLTCPFETVLASRSGIAELMQRAYGATEEQMDEMMGDLDADDIESRELDVDDDDDEDDAPVIKLAMMIIAEAVKQRASDIHIEPMDNRLRVRYRVDGVCREIDSPPKRLQKPLISRFKIMSGMDIAEKRLPQDGRIKLNLVGKSIDLRVNSLPAVHGESIVLRILDKDSISGGLGDTGMSDSDERLFKKLIKRPNGIILVTGPTGSGKTTTLYAALNELNTPNRKIITAENPVEYYLSGINQAQVDEAAGMNFARIIRSMLRQAPNIILIGEIRDMETAEIAVEASLTGHLVFSTLHTNDAPSAITRLTDIGIKPFLVASSIQAIIAQRLVRRLCPECKEETTLSPAMIAALELKAENVESATVYKPKGCTACDNKGYKGRLAVFEMLVMSAPIRRMAFAGATTNELKKTAIASGMNPLLVDGAQKVLAGLTTPEEVLKVARTKV